MWHRLTQFRNPVIKVSLALLYTICDTIESVEIGESMYFKYAFYYLYIRSVTQIKEYIIGSVIKFIFND